MQIATNSHCFVLMYCSLWDRKEKEGEGREESGERERTEERREEGKCQKINWVQPHEIPCAHKGSNT